MKFRSFQKARTRIALFGALLSVLLLALLALGTRSLIRSRTFADIDDGLDTLAIAIGSDFELEGLEEARRDRLRAGIKANEFEYRLANHSAILFKGEVPVALSGDLLRSELSVSFAPYRNKPESPYTAVEPYSGQRRTCRFLVTRLGARAQGAALVIFRPIEANLRALARLDRALLAFVVLGFLGTALIQAVAVTRALRPVEEVTHLAREVEATDLSRRVHVGSVGEEFRRLADVINALLDRLERAFQAQRRLVADAAHELKTPAAVLLGEAQEALRDEATPEERRGSLEAIERTARSLAREVDDLLLLARADAAPKERREAVDLAEVAAQSVASACPLGTSRGVRCSVARDCGATTVLGDRSALLRLASNLISNALLYTAAGSAVDVVTAGGDGEVFLEVRDRGPGIAPEDRARIFERFARLDSGRSFNPEGAGLGLAIVDQVVRSHGGRIEVLDREGGGSIFRAVFPAVGVRSEK